MGEMRKRTAKRNEFWRDLPDRYCAAARWAFTHLLAGLPAAAVGEDIQANFHLDPRQAHGVVRDAQTILAELL